MNKPESSDFSVTLIPDSPSIGLSRVYEVSRNEKCLPAMLWKLLFDCMCVLRTAVCVSTLLLSNYLCTRSQFRFDLGITKTLLLSRGVHNSKGALATNVLQLCFSPKAALKSSLLKRNLFIQENCLYKLILIYIFRPIWLFSMVKS